MRRALFKVKAQMERNEKNKDKTPEKKEFYFLKD